MGWGDELMAAGQAARLHREDPLRRKVAICDANGKPRWHPAWEGLPFIWRESGHDPRHASRRELVQSITNCSGHRPYFVPPLSPATGFTWSGWKASEHRPVIALTDEEETLGKFWRGRLGRYLAIEPNAMGGNTHLRENRHWGAARFQRFVDLRPDIAIVQVGVVDTPSLNGVVRVVTSNFREAAGVLSGADAYVGCQGGLHHAAAALGVPAVIVWSGAEPPDLMGYPDNMNLQARLPGTPCGQIQPCGHCRQALEAITPEAVSAALTVLLMRVEQRHAAAGRAAAAAAGGD